MPAHNAPPSGTVQGVNIRPPEQTTPKGSSAAGLNKPGVSKAPAPLLNQSKMVALPGAAEIASRSKSSGTSILDETPKVETMSSAPAEKEESINVAKEIIKDHPALDHLSAPASAIHSGTATPQPEQTAASTERGDVTAAESSEVKDLSPDEVKNTESENSLPGEKKNHDDVDTSKDVESTNANEEEKTQEQGAKEPDDATKSVGD